MIITELLNTVYPHRKVLDHRGVYLVEFIDEHGSLIEIEITKQGDTDIWLLEFTRDGSTKLTGQGNAAKILGTVAAVATDFLHKKVPAFLVFSAAKEDRARASVYRRIISRLKDRYYRELDLDGERFNLSSENESKLHVLRRRAGNSEFIVLGHRDEIQPTVNEILNRAATYDVVAETPSKFKTRARIGKRDIVFTAELEQGEEGEYWSIAFHEQTGNGITYSKTGSGDELKVLAMVKGSIAEFLDRYHPEILHFTADTTEGRARANVYRQLMDRSLRGYESEEYTEAGEHVFIYRRR